MTSFNIPKWMFLPLIGVSAHATLGGQPFGFYFGVDKINGGTYRLNLYLTIVWVSLGINLFAGTEVA